MRTREEIWGDRDWKGPAGDDNLMIEILLDIRELLANPPMTIEAASIEEVDKAAALLPDLAFEEAKAIALELGTGATITPVILLEKMGGSYGRASALIDKLEAAGIIGPKEGGKPRKVL
jgi:hypothetical protein